MKDIKTGEYVRFENGVISQMEEGKIIGDFLFSEVVKISPNIIDLIELGDLVRLFMEDNLDKEDTNIFEVIAITRDKKEIGVFTKDCELDFYPIENLRGIVTKEQFESMEYRIGE